MGAPGLLPPPIGGVRRPVAPIQLLETCSVCCAVIVMEDSAADGSNDFVLSYTKQDRRVKSIFQARIPATGD